MKNLKSLYQHYSINTKFYCHRNLTRIKLFTFSSQKDNQKNNPEHQSIINFYQTLNINEDASFDQIKKKFKHLSKIYHPDRNKQNDNKFIQIQKAYKILTSIKTRKQHDLNLGIKNSLWQSQSFGLKSDQFQNQTIDQFLKSNTKNYQQNKSLQARLQQKFQKEIKQQTTLFQSFKLLGFSGIGFVIFWVVWNFSQYLLVNYKGKQSYKMQRYQGDKKLSAVPINIG